MDGILTMRGKTNEKLNCVPGNSIGGNVIGRFVVVFVRLLVSTSISITNEAKGCMETCFCFLEVSNCSSGAVRALLFFFVGAVACRATCCAFSRPLVGDESVLWFLLAI